MGKPNFMAPFSSTGNTLYVQNGQLFFLPQFMCHWICHKEWNWRKV